HGALAVRGQLHLDRARSRRDHRMPLPSPREDDPTGRVDLHVLPAGHGLVVDLHAVDAAGPGVQLGLPPLPPGHLGGVDEEPEHGLRTRIDAELPDYRPLRLPALSFLLGHARPSPRPSVAAVAGGWAASSRPCRPGGPAETLPSSGSSVAPA